MPEGPALMTLGDWDLIKNEDFSRDEATNAKHLQDEPFDNNTK